jgi:hypothetical protein
LRTLKKKINIRKHSRFMLIKFCLQSLRIHRCTHSGWAWSFLGGKCCAVDSVRGCR